MILCFDYGHGGKDPGACYMGRKESEDVLSIGKEVANYLRQYGIVVDETRTSDVTVSLGDRVRFENQKKYDYFISFHRNAYMPEVANGVETYTYLSGGASAGELAKRIQNSLVSLGFRDRGVKRANFYVLKATKAPAVLVELGFIDNSKDNNIFDLKKDQIIQALCQALRF